MQSEKVQLRIICPPCGALHHPAFQNAIMLPDGNYRLDYPLHIKGIQKSRKAQEAWALEKAKHIRSWGGGFSVLIVG
jgi:hypothetical protein